MSTAYASPYDRVAPPLDVLVDVPVSPPSAVPDEVLAPVIPLRRAAPAVSDATYRRRRVVVGGAVVLGLLLVLAGGRAMVRAATTVPVTAVVAPVPITDTVQLEPGDTLWELAVANTAVGEDPRVTLQAIRDLNGFGTDVVPAWTTVAIPGR